MCRRLLQLTQNVCHSRVSTAIASHVQPLPIHMVARLRSLRTSSNQLRYARPMWIAALLMVRALPGKITRQPRRKIHLTVEASRLEVTILPIVPTRTSAFVRMTDHQLGVFAALSAPSTITADFDPYAWRSHAFVDTCHVDCCAQRSLLEHASLNGDASSAHRERNSSAMPFYACVARPVGKAELKASRLYLNCCQAQFQLAVKCQLN